jgi:hypothetical protein
LLRLTLLVVVLAVLAGVGRALLPGIVRDYVNRTLDRSPLYAGEIGTLNVHLWRGAYSIQDVRINKRMGSVPVPFFAARRIDFSVQWDALLHGRLVGRIFMLEPELNFVDAPSGEESQTGEDGPWLGMLKDLFPFQINRAIIQDGSIHLRVYWTQPPFDTYLSDVQATIDNLSNIHDETNPLVSTVQAEGRVMDQAPFEYRMMLDPFSYRPTFRLTTRILGLDVTRINDLARAYGNLDFRAGWFDFVLEVDVKEGQLTGYAKPLFRNLEAFTIPEDLQPNPVQILWEAIAGAAIKLLENQPREQFGTLIPFSGDLSTSTTVDLMATIGNLLRNAFVRAYLPHLEPTDDTAGFLEFEPPEFPEILSNP